MRVILTRPQAESHAWKAQLARHGIESCVLPLIAIGPAPDARALRAAWSRLPHHRAVMFVSANAVRGFVPQDAGWPDGPRAWAPGPGTRDALLAAGVPEARVDAPAADAGQFDSETLWRAVAPQVRAGDVVLLVRGGDTQGRATGREWLAGQVAAAGGHCESVVAYTRGAPVWSAADQEAALAEGGLWLFSSSEAVANLRALLPDHDWSAAQALATHPRIAQAARAAGFGRVDETRPAFADVLASIESRR
jgi:uroporphyrinogen-III synthase